MTVCSVIVFLTLFEYAVAQVRLVLHSRFLNISLQYLLRRTVASIRIKGRGSSKLGGVTEELTTDTLSMTQITATLDEGEVRDQNFLLNFLQNLLLN